MTAYTDLQRALRDLGKAGGLAPELAPLCGGPTTWTSARRRLGRPHRCRLTQRAGQPGAADRGADHTPGDAGAALARLNRLARLGRPRDRPAPPRRSVRRAAVRRTGSAGALAGEEPRRGAVLVARRRSASDRRARRRARAGHPRGGCPGVGWRGPTHVGIRVGRRRVVLTRRPPHDHLRERADDADVMQFTEQRHTQGLPCNLPGPSSPCGRGTA
jgi:hypothetical protein